MGILVDTSVLIAAERGQVDLRQPLWLRPGAEFRISAITASELLHGIHRATDPAIREFRLQFVNHILDHVQIVPIEIDVARVHAKLWADLRRQGGLIDAHDLWIAATCLHHNLRLLTANRKHFDRIPQLILEEG